MPKAGFKSITVSERVYDKFQDVYQKSKDDLAMKGVNSFSGYVTYMLEEMMQKDKTFARYAPKIEKISVDDDRVILKDNIKKDRKSTRLNSSHSSVSRMPSSA